jgi:uncharacterized protein (DUF697 family)
MRAGPALFLGFVLLGLIRTFPMAILTIVGVIAATVLLTWGAFALGRMLDRRHEAHAAREARDAIRSRADEQHAWTLAGDDRGLYGQFPPGAPNT